MSVASPPSRWISCASHWKSSYRSGVSGRRYAERFSGTAPSDRRRRHTRTRRLDGVGGTPTRRRRRGSFMFRSETLVSWYCQARMRARVARTLALPPSIVAMSAAVLLMAAGENLWKRFVPKYLEALGAPVTAIGVFGSCQDLLDGVYQYPGGWIGDRYGRRSALVLFLALAAIGYGLYWAAPSWPFVFAGLAFVMAWSSMASPTLFAVVGDALPRERRALGFTVQSILRRIPIALAPAAGGIAIATYGVVGGVHLGLAVTLILTVITLAAVWRIDIAVLADDGPATMRLV